MNIVKRSHINKPTLVTSLRILAVAAALGWLATPLLAVAPVNPTDVAGTHDEVFRVLAPSVADANLISQGTGTVFDFEIQLVGNKSYCRMCLVTADHVVAQTAYGDIEFGFRNENPVGTFGPNGFNFEPEHTRVKRGAHGVATANGWAGGGVDKPDIAFIGVTIDLSNVGGTPPSGPGFLDATKALLLTSAAADAIPLQAIGPNVFPQFTFHGYGTSGRPPTQNEINNIANAADYAYLRHNNANDEDFGILRPLSETATILEFQNAQNGSLGGPPYKYEEALGWQLTAGQSYGLGGDSGAALVDGTDHIVGIFNLSDGDTFDPPVSNIVEGVKIGMLEYAVALTQDYVNWLSGNCDSFLSSQVPEPSTGMLLLLGFALSAIQQRRR